MKQKVYLLLIAITLLFFGCEKIELGKAFDCHMGTNYKVNNDLSFIINRISDSRCPENVECAVIGDASLNFNIKLKGNNIDTVLFLNPTWNPPNAIFGGYDFGIYSIEPKGLATTSSKTVTITMVISKQ
jgi:hypothetical protein